jgi:hypothetical protein
MIDRSVYHYENNWIVIKFLSFLPSNVSILKLEEDLDDPVVLWRVVAEVKQL